MRTGTVILIAITLVVSCKTVPPDYSAPKAINDTQASIRNITIEGPFKDLIYNRRMDAFDTEKLEWNDSYQKVKVTYDSKSFEGTVRQRGGISYCNAFPQLKLKLAKDQKIEGQKEFKIITHGFYTLDPKVPINAPTCGNDLYGEETQLGVNAFENILYDLSTLLLDTHLKNMKFMVNYLDTENHIDVTQKAYFIEDRKAAAKRYKLQSVDLSGPEWDSAWRIDAEDEMIDSVVSDLYKAKLKIAYEDLKKAKPQAPDEEIAAAMTAFKKPSEQEMADFNTRAVSVKDEAIRKRKEAQIQLLKRIVPKSLAHTILFELMIANSDWNVLGANDHSETLKNMELFKDLNGDRYYVAPYDFDESHMGGLTANAYKDRFATFRKQLPADLVGIVLPSIKEHGPEFIKRLEALPSSYPLTPDLEETLAAYAVALKEFAAGL